MKITLRIVLLFCLIAVVIGAGAIGVRVNDTLNMHYKRLKAGSPYTFDEVDPTLLKTDPAGLIAVRGPADLGIARRDLTGWTYGVSDGTRRAGRLFNPGAGWSQAPDVADWSGLGAVHQLYITVRPDVISYAYHLTPSTQPNGKALIYHHGMASDFRAARDWLVPFLEEGWTVLAFDQLGYGENSREALCEPAAPNPDSCRANLQSEIGGIDTPAALHVEPVLAGVDYLEQRGFASVDAMGFSAGAATVTFAAAQDLRIRRTVAVAGILPLYLREDQDQVFGLAKHWADTGSGSFLDLFILASSGPGRAYLQVFNRYDRCCFRNLKGRHYEDAVRQAVSDIGDGQFAVHIDETHARHTVSDAAVDVIRGFLTDPG